MSSSLRRSQEQRRSEARALIATATITALAHHGYAATTIAGVAQAAGVSRGAMLHYYPQKTDLVAGVIDDQVAAALRGLDDRVAVLPRGRKRVPAALDFIRDAYDSTLSQAVLAVQVAARADTELRARVDPVWATVPARIEQLAPQLFGPAIAGRRDLPLLVGLIIATVRGVATVDAVEGRTRDDKLWAYTRRHLAALLHQSTATR
jgi:AcrR family transcriptional regulator